MRSIRYVVAGLVGLAAVIGTLYAIPRAGSAGASDAAGGLYSDFVVYPAVILAGCFAFWIVFAALDPGSEK